jgi:hypothetical protein
MDTRTTSNLFASKHCITGPIMEPSTTFPTDSQKAIIDANPRHLPCHILHHHNISCVVWFEDAIAVYGAPVVVFDLYILVPDIDTASSVLVQYGWSLVSQEKGKIGNATVDFPQRHLTPPSRDSHETRLPGSPVPDISLPGPTTTVLLPAADWNFSLPGIGSTTTKPFVDIVVPPLIGLVDALIDSLLDCPSDYDMLRTHLAVQITSLYRWAPALKEKAFAEQMMYEHRQYHLDVLSGMDHGTVPFINHQRSNREALRQKKHVLQECSSSRDNEALFGRKVRERLLASMPKPRVNVEGDRKGDGWGVRSNLEEKEGMPSNHTKLDDLEKIHKQ